MKSKEVRINRSRKQNEIINSYMPFTYNKIIDIRCDKELCPKDYVYYHKEFINSGFTKDNKEYPKTLDEFIWDKRFQLLELSYSVGEVMQFGDIKIGNAVKEIKDGVFYFQDDTSIDYDDVVYFYIMKKSIFKDSKYIIILAKNRFEDEYFCYVDDYVNINNRESLRYAHIKDLKKLKLMTGKMVNKYYELGIDKEIYSVNPTDLSLEKLEEGEFLPLNLCEYDDKSKLKIEMLGFIDFELSDLPLKLLDVEGGLYSMNNWLKELLIAEYKRMNYTENEVKVWENYNERLITE